MKKQLLLIAVAMLSTLGIQAQMNDVTAQYIPNAGFEECDALPTVVYHDNQKNIDINKIELYSVWNEAKGVDYEAQGWKLVEQNTNANGGVVTYGCNIQSGKYATAGEPGPAEGVTGTKGLCFTGSAGLVYQQANEITLPAGIYRLTVNLYARNGQTSNPGPTQQVVNDHTGFMPTGGTEENDLIPAIRKSMQFASNAWDTEIIDIELTQPTTGRFQIGYGSSYFVVVDDVKLEYQGGVVTTALTNVIGKAQTLNGVLNSSELTAAIQTAENFIANPTTQDEVATQVEALYNAMATALAATTVPVEITAAYVENPSFESGKIDPWTWVDATGTVGEPVNSASKPFIDGKNIVEFSTTGTNGVKQTISHLPAGYYAVDAKLNMKAFLKVGTSSKLIQGGTDALYLRVHPTVYHATSAGDLTVASQASVAYRVDNFRLFYGKDETSLLAALLPAVQDDARAVIAMSDLDIVTGQERTNLQSAIEGTDIDAINTAIEAFVNGKDNYSKFEKAKTAAAAYNEADYPYASKTIYEQIQTLVNSEAQSAADALAKAGELSQLCLDYYVSNAYCEGVKGAVDCTSSIAGANATGTNVAAAWHKLNMQIRTDKTAWKNPKTSEDDKNVYGVTADYYREAKDKTSYMYQTISGLSAGKYVLSVTYMSANTISPEVQVNGVKVGELKGVGAYGGGVYGGGWIENVIEFDKADGTDMELRLTYVGTANYQDWYFDNLRLYRIEGTIDGIEMVQPSALECQPSTSVVYDLQGRRVAQPTKGLYIVNGKKVVLN